MKRIYHLYSTLLSSLAIFLLLSGCKKDVLDSKELLVYMDGDYSSLNNTMTMSFLHTPVDVQGNTTLSVVAYATRDVPADVDVTIVADTSLVGQYNRANNTNCRPLPPAAYKIVNPGKHTIPSGGLASDSMQLVITDPASLTDTNGYLLPLTIASVAGKDRGVQISTNRGTTYVRITYQFNNIVATEQPMTGVLADRTGWSVTVSNTTSGSLGPAMLDGSNSTAWRSSNSSTAAKYAIMNMGSLQTINGFQLVPDYVSTGDNATQIKVSTSPDSTVWTVQGTWNGTGAASGSSATHPVIKGINFIAPVQAKYFRFDILAWVSGSRTGIGELNVVQ